MIDLSRITPLDLVIAAATDDLDEAVLPLQNALGITDGGLCGMHLNEENWKHSTQQGRIWRLRMWLHDENRD